MMEALIRNPECREHCSSTQFPFKLTGPAHKVCPHRRLWEHIATIKQADGTHTHYWARASILGNLPTYLRLRRHQ